jgi:hydroxyacylglutathione hydrolase
VTDHQDVAQIFVKGLVVGLFQTNCYIVGSRISGEAVCIDPGDETEEILALARDLGVRITRLVASHAHLDHVMAVGAMKEATGATFLMHPADHEILLAVPESAARWLSQRVPTPPAPDFHLADGDDLVVGH